MEVVGWTVWSEPTGQNEWVTERYTNIQLNIRRKQLTLKKTILFIGFWWWFEFENKNRFVESKIITKRSPTFSLFLITFHISHLTFDLTFILRVVQVTVDTRENLKQRMTLKKSKRKNPTLTRNPQLMKHKWPRSSKKLTYYRSKVKTQAT